MSNLLDKSSIVLTPTAYDNSKVLCVKPSDGSGDFDFSRNSAATRVNAQGLVENVQILSSNLVQNGDFSQQGAEKISNGSFSQEGSELITNGDFATDSDWTLTSGSSIENGKLTIDALDGSYQYARQIFSTTIGSTYKLEFDITEINDVGKVQLLYNNVVIGEAEYTSIGTHTLYFESTNSSGTLEIKRGFPSSTNLSIDNVSVREVGQDWTLGTGWSVDQTNSKAICDGTQTSTSTLQTTQVISNIQNDLVKLSFEIKDYSAGAISVTLQGTGGIEFSNLAANGVYEIYVTVIDANPRLLFNANSSFVGSVTNISVKEVAQNWTSPDYNSALSIVGGQLKIESTVSLGRVVQAVTTVVGKTYLASANITNIDSSTGIQLKLSNGANLDGAFFNSSFNTTTNIVTIKHNFVATATTTYIGTSQGSSVGQSGLLGNVSVIQITNDTNLPRINYEGFSFQDALGSELVNSWTNKDFASFSSSGSNITQMVSSGSGNNNYSALTITSGKTYKLKFTSSQAITCQIRISANTNLTGASVVLNPIVLGTNEVYFTASSNYAYIGFYAPTSFTDTQISNFTLKEVTGQEVVPDSGCGSWLWEPQSTNLITYSEDFSNGYWVKDNSTVTSGFVSPDGTTSAYKLIEDASNTTHKLWAQETTLASTYSFSLFAKAGERRRIGLRDNQVGNNAIFDLISGTVVSGNGSIVALTNGYYRISLTGTYNAAGTRHEIYILEDNATNINAAYQGDGTSGVYIWGAQLEALSYASSLIPTSGSTVTRNQDLCNNAGNSDLFNDSAGALYFEGSVKATNENLCISINDGTTSNRVELLWFNDGNFYTQVGNSGQTSILSNTNNNKIAIGWGSGVYYLYLNGSVVITDTFTSLSGLKSLDFKRQGSFEFYGNVKTVAVFKEALSDSELASLTTI